MADTEDYHLWLFYSDGYTTLSPGAVEFYGDEGLPTGAYLSVRCANCDAMNLLYAALDEAVAADEREMGAEVWHSLHFWQDCAGCGEELDFQADLTEYPVLSLNLQALETHGASKHEVIHGLGGFAKAVKRSTQTPRDLLEELEAAREALHFAFQGEEKPNDIIALLDKLVEARKTFVVVLGNYHTSGATLQEIKQELAARGFTARLVKELPDFEDKSVAQKAFLGMSQAAFCVMLDDTPSGHILEYGHADKNEVILGRITPAAGGSTWMIGEQGKPDGHHVKEFRLTKPLPQVIDDLVEWAQEAQQARATAFKREYPWLNKHAEVDEE